MRQHFWNILENAISFTYPNYKCLISVIFFEVLDLDLAEINSFQNAEFV